MDTIELFESLAMLAREKGIEPQVLENTDCPYICYKRIFREVKI